MLILILRTVILYCSVVFSMRIMGKRQMGELQPSELVVAIMISDLASVPMQAIDIPLLSGIIPVLTLIVIEVCLSFVSRKSKILRKILSGEPSILIYEGKIRADELSRLRFSVNDLLEELRSNNFHNIADVEAAILETNGKLSIIPKSNARPVTTDDMNIEHPRPDGLPYIIISDGTFNTNELKRADITKEKATTILQKHGVDDIKNVILASIDVNKKLTLQLYTD